MKRFGLEMEWVGNTAAVIAALRNAGVPVVDSTRTHLGHSETHWTVKRDGSVPGGGELVSPPMDFTDPAAREQVNQAVLALQAADAKPHHKAGIHVHIEAKHADGTHMTAREIAAVVRFTYKFEDAIYRIASSGWQTIRPGARTYAKPIPEATARKIMQVKTIAELERCWDGTDLNGRMVRDAWGGRRRFGQSLDRYTATNLRSFFQRGTIEFRYFNSSVNPDRVQAYIALCMAIVDDARNGYSRSVKKSYRIGAMATGQVTEKALMLRLQQVLRSNGKDSTVCMSVEDWKNLRKTCWNGSKAQSDIF